MVFRTWLLLILVLCAFAGVAAADVTRDEVIAFKQIGGSSNSQAGDEVLEVDEQEIGTSRRNVERASDLELTKYADHSEAKLAEEKAWVVTLKAGMTGNVENTSKTTPVDKSTHAVPPPSPLIESKNTSNFPPPANTTMISPPPRASTGDSGKAPPARGGACDHGPVIGMLAPTGGEDSHHEYTLTVKNVGKSKLSVAVQTSSGWKATPAELALSKGQNKTVTVSATDNEAVRHAAKLNISWSDGDCYVAVPAQNVPSDVDHSSYSTFLNAPGTAALLLGGSLVFLVVLGVAGVWGCISWRAHARRHGDVETKYQELEMAATDTTKLGGDDDDERGPSADGWDEVWEDDDWQDMEAAARTSSTAVTLSSAGLNSRRANKDGWDSSWDD